MIIAFDPVLGNFGAGLRKEGFALYLMLSGSGVNSMTDHFNTTYLREEKAKQRPKL